LPDAPLVRIGDASALVLAQETIVGAYLAQYENSPRTKLTMSRALERIGRILKAAPETIAWWELEYVHTAAIRARLLQSCKPATVAVTLSALRGILRTCARRKLMTYQAVSEATDWPRINSSRLPAGRDLSTEELAKVREFCGAQKGAYGSFLRSTLGLMIGAGLRATEACEALTDDLDVANTRLRIVGKGDKEGFAVFGELEAIALSEWMLTRRVIALETPRLLGRVHADGGLAAPPGLTTSALAHLCKLVSVETQTVPFTPHDCRRTFCTRLLAAGVDLTTVQRLMRHEDPKTTARYDKRTLELDAAARRKAMVW
jgi:integrase/recombinase XerD